LSKSITTATIEFDDAFIGLREHLEQEADDLEWTLSQRQLDDMIKQPSPNQLSADALFVTEEMAANSSTRENIEFLLDADPYCLQVKSSTFQVAFISVHSTLQIDDRSSTSTIVDGLSTFGYR
jgi:hypothetical protein